MKKMTIPAASPFVRDDGGVRRITFNRPETLNAMIREDLHAIVAAINEAPAGTRAIVFESSTTRAFSAGMHLKAFDGLNRSSARDLIADIGTLLETVGAAPYATFCLIQGHCLGAAAELALASDFRIATPDSSIGLPEIKLGFPSVLYAARLADFVGPSIASEMILTGDSVKASQLAGTSLFTRIVDAGELETTLQGILERVLASSSAAVAAQKRLFEIWLNSGLREAVQVSIDEWAAVMDALARTDANAT